MPAVASSGGTDLIQKIQQERRIELCFEGHRFFDLRRWGKAEDGLVTRLELPLRLLIHPILHLRIR
jgi:hypothetical protein